MLNSVHKHLSYHTAIQWWSINPQPLTGLLPTVLLRSSVLLSFSQLFQLQLISHQQHNEQLSSPLKQPADLCQNHRSVGERIRLRKRSNEGEMLQQNYKEQLNLFVPSYTVTEGLQKHAIKLTAQDETSLHACNHCVTMCVRFQDCNYSRGERSCIYYTVTKSVISLISNKRENKKLRVMRTRQRAFFLYGVLTPKHKFTTKKPSDI